MTSTTSFLRPLLLLIPYLASHANAATFTVTSTANTGPGSLRQAVADAVAAPGADTVDFDPTVFNGEPADVIRVTSRIIINATSDELMINAQDIPQGVVLSGGGQNRVLEVQGTHEVWLKGMTVANGLNLAVGGSGGAIMVSGELTLEDCAIRNCVNGTSGGAIYSTGTLTLDRCSLTGSTAPLGGGIHAQGGSLTLTRCTFSGNSAQTGGAVALTGNVAATFDFCTVSGNAGTTAPTFGAGISTISTGTLQISNSIVAGNVAQNGADIQKSSGTLIFGGRNLIGDNASIAAEAAEGQPNAAGSWVGTTAAPVRPMLAVLANYGGRTDAMPPMLGSPALDRITPAPPYATDQRGFGHARKLFAATDIGAVESGTLGGCGWETVELFPAAGTVASLAAAEVLAANGQAAGVTALSGTRSVINHADPDTSPSAGYFPGDEPFTANNLTPSSTAAGDDNDFVLLARSFIRVSAEDDYTLGFACDEAARLRIFSTDGAADPQFISSKRLVGSANPTHAGNTLSYANAGSSDTIGVVHLLPGTYALELLSWERAGGAQAEVFAARGALTSMTNAFRLVGDQTSIPDTPGIMGTWDVDVIQRGAATMNDAISQVNDLWCGSRPVTNIRFLSANDGSDRDPLQFTLQGTNGSLASGPWTTVVNGSTNLPLARRTWGSPTYLAAPVMWRHYRVIFRNLRGTSTGEVQIGEVELRDAGDFDQIPTRAAVVAFGGSSPGGEGPAQAIDDNDQTKLLIFLSTPGALTGNEGLAFSVGTQADLTNVTSTRAVNILYRDPEAALTPGHGTTPANFPGNTAADDNNFALGARALLSVPAQGYYTFALVGDDTMRLRIPGMTGWTVAGTGVVPLPDGLQTTAPVSEALGTVWLPAGRHRIELIYHESTGPAGVGLWAAAGVHTSFSTRLDRHFKAIASSPLATAAPAVSLVDPAGTAPRPANDDFARAIPLYGQNPHAVVCPEAATMEAGEPTDNDVVMNSVWYRWTTSTPGHYDIWTVGSTVRTTLGIYTGNAVGELTAVATSTWGGLDRTQVAFHAVAGTEYFIQLGVATGRSAAGSRLMLQMRQLPAPPANDALSTAQPLAPVAHGSFFSDNSGATTAAAEPGLGTDLAAYNTVWFDWTAPWSGEFTFDTQGSNFDTILALYTGTAPALSLAGWSDDAGGLFLRSSQVTIQANAGTTYHIQIGGYDQANKGRVVLNITSSPAILDSLLHTDAGGGEVFTLRWNSAPALPVRVQASSDLGIWEDLTRCTPAASPETILDIVLPAGGTPRQFFRVLGE